MNFIFVLYRSKTALKQPDRKSLEAYEYNKFAYKRQWMRNLQQLASVHTGKVLHRFVAILMDNHRENRRKGLTETRDKKRVQGRWREGTIFFSLTLTYILPGIHANLCLFHESP